MIQQTILITGVGGFLGQQLSNYFYLKGFKIIGVGRFKNKIPSTMTMYNLSLPDEKFAEILNKHKPDIIIHCAGSSSVSASLISPYDDFIKTVELCGFVLESIRTCSPKSKFIYLSSAAVYGNPMSLPINEEHICQPISPYGYHKILSELLIKEYSQLFGIKSVVFRVFSVYGEGLRRQVIYDLCSKLTSHSNVIEVYGNGLESRDFIHSVDVCRAVELVVSQDIIGTFNLANGNEISISKLIEILKLFINSNKSIQFIGKTRAGDPTNWRADITKLTQKGFKPEISFEQGLESYCKWFLGGNKS
jgi:UDP-glucose 4-epimerase